MSHPKRLFLFAGYNKDNSLDESLCYYIKQISKFGDVILCMDNDIKKSGLKKLQKYTIAIIAKKHGEYDFGSYKRAYIYAKENKILKKYDIIYLVNDSVFGPLFNINQTIETIESLNTDAASLIISKHKTHSFMESWFVRLNKKIFLSSWFDKFIMGVEKQKTKARITIKYEHGLSNLIKENYCFWDGIYKFKGRFTYNHPKSLFNLGCPFIKKACFTRHDGAFGNQIKYVLNHCDKNAHNTIIKSANKIYGKDYINWLLTYNPIKIFARKFRYAVIKLRNGGI